MYSRQSPEKEMHNTILISLLLMLLPVSVSAQFYTITRDSEILPTERQKEAYSHAGKDVTRGNRNKMMAKDTLTIRSNNHNESEENSRNSDRKASLRTELQKKTDDITKSGNNLPELTIPIFIKKSLETESYILKSYWLRLYWKLDGSVHRYVEISIIFLDLPIHVQGNTMNSIIGQKVSGLIIQKFNTSIKVVTICFGLMRLDMRKIRII